jgi:hypothetical protein
MAPTDDIGGRGESLCYVRLSDFCGRKQPYFRPHFLGEKFPALDFLVELVNAGKRTLYFFVQVKATRQGYTRRPPVRLKVDLSAADAERLVLYPAPTYLVGIDEVGETGFVVAANEKLKGGLSGLPTLYPLDGEHLQRLWEEVREYWRARDMTLRRSAFSL